MAGPADGAGVVVEGSAGRSYFLMVFPSGVRKTFHLPVERFQLGFLMAIYTPWEVNTFLVKVESGITIIAMIQI